MKQFFINNYPNLITQFINIINHNKKYDFLIIGLTSKEIKGKIIYCMTSNINAYLNQLKTQIKEIKENDNKKNILENMLINCIKYYKDKNKLYPNYIIIYREGGNEWKNKYLATEEINIFLEKINDIKKINNDIKIKLYYICTNLKSELKFYQKIENKENNKYINPKSGLIVDDTVTKKDVYEFYLQPQFVNQGSANPTQFQVMYYDKEDIDNLKENLQNLTFYLCFYYWTWNGAVRIPALLKMAITALDFCIKCNVINKNFFETPIYI